jgi:hypothetical protein
MKSRLIVLLALLLLIYNCDKKTTAPDEAGEIELTETEQMDLVAAEVATNNGGLMADVAIATTVAKGGYGSLAKSTSFDTTFTRGWITYSLSLAFYTAQGVEQNWYIPNFTDKIVYNGSLTGQHSAENPHQEISLNKSAAFIISGITTNVITINGSATNNSSYKFSGVRTDLEVQVQSSYVATNLGIDRNANSYIPQSGKIECTFHGTYTKTGVIKAKDVEYSFTVTIEFNGGTQVKVTLPSGNQFTLDIVTGDVT